SDRDWSQTCALPISLTLPTILERSGKICPRNRCEQWSCPACATQFRRGERFSRNAPGWSGASKGNSSSCRAWDPPGGDKSGDASTNFWPRGGGGRGVEHLANWIINLVANGGKF